MAAKHVKCVLVGDGGVGKRCLITTFTYSAFPDYVNTMMHPHCVSATAGGKPIDLELWYTAGQEEYDRLRPLSYAMADVFLICFSVVSPASFDNVAVKWTPELRHHAPAAPVILVGTKTDLRQDAGVLSALSKEGQAPLTELQGHDMAQRIRAFKYVECSALSQDNLSQVFDDAVCAVLDQKQRTKTKMMSFSSGRCSAM